MRKFIALFTMCLSLMLVSPSFANTGLRIDNEPLGTVTNVRYNTSGLVGQDKSKSFDGSTLTYNLFLAGSGTSGAVSLTTSGLNVERGRSLVYKAIGTTVDEGIIHSGLPGEIIVIEATEVGSGGTWAIEPASTLTTQTWRWILFDAVGDKVTLLYTSTTIGWIIVAETGVVVQRASF